MPKNYHPQHNCLKQITQERFQCLKSFCHRHPTTASQIVPAVSCCHLLLILTNFRFWSLAYLSENFLFNLLWFKPKKKRTQNLILPRVKSISGSKVHQLLYSIDRSSLLFQNDTDCWYAIEGQSEEISSAELHLHL